MKKVQIFLFLLICVLAYFTYKPSNQVEEVEEKEVITQEGAGDVHIHAGFQVYRDNSLVDFSGFRYMHIEPCNEEESHEHEDEQLEKAHLHSSIGDVVHVHKKDSFWKDLFENIKVPIDSTSSSYINGVLVDDFLNMPILDHDVLVIFEGENDSIQEKLLSTISKDRIIEAESTIESCGK